MTKNFAVCRFLSLSSAKRRSKSALMRCKKFNRARVRSYPRDGLSKGVPRTYTAANLLVSKISKKRARIKMPLSCWDR